MVIEINSDEVLTAPVASATVMVLRDSPNGPEVLMMRRHGNSSVLGGAHVFPGGKLDPQDVQVDPALLDQPPARILLGTRATPSAIANIRAQYGLDEPDDVVQKKMQTQHKTMLKRLRDIGNSVIVVEHDHDAIMHADHVVGAARDRGDTPWGSSPTPSGSC